MRPTLLASIHPWLPFGAASQNLMPSPLFLTGVGAGVDFHELPGHFLLPKLAWADSGEVEGPKERSWGGPGVLEKGTRRPGGADPAGLREAGSCPSARGGRAGGGPGEETRFWPLASYG